MKIFLIANKCNLLYEGKDCKVQEIITEFSQKWKLDGCLMVSAKEGTNVNEAFEQMVSQIDISSCMKQQRERIEPISLRKKSHLKRKKRK